MLRTRNKTGAASTTRHKHRRARRHEPSIGWHTLADAGEREHVLKGDWTVPPTRSFPRVRRLGIVSWGFNFRGATNLNYLSLFPGVVALRILWGGLSDIGGINQLRHLRNLTINNLLPKHLRVDLAAFPELRSLSTLWSKHLTNLHTLRKLTSLHLHHIYGVKHLDFSTHPELRRLDVGPAKAVESVNLEGLRKLKSLGLALMPQLVSISGRDFYDTVTGLDIRGSHSLPPEFLGSFTKLRFVEIGMSSRLTAADFPRSRPTIVHEPV